METVKNLSSVNKNACSEYVELQSDYQKYPTYIFITYMSYLLTICYKKNLNVTKCYKKILGNLLTLVLNKKNI